MRETCGRLSPACFTEHCTLSRCARSDLILLFKARERRSYLGVAAPVVGVTHNGHHLKLPQCSDESGQGNPSMLLRGSSGEDRSSSTEDHLPRTPSRRSHLVVFGGEEFYDLSSHEMVAFHLETDSSGLSKVCVNWKVLSLQTVCITSNTVPGSVWWSRGQRSTSHHACISSALDPLWRMEWYHCHSGNLRTSYFLIKM